MGLIERSAKVSTPHDDVQPKMPYFLLTQRKEELLELAYYSIAASLAPKATAVLSKMAAVGDDYSYPPTKGSSLDFWGAWKHSFFCRKLPLQSVLKIVDVYMGEGHKAILRVALALLELHAPALTKGK
jgi:hypothetical protein